jgi:hypothetical protein
MMRVLRFIIVGLAALLAVVGEPGTVLAADRSSGILGFFYDFFDDGFEEACTKVLEKKLAVPSTLKIVNFDRRESRRQTFEEFKTQSEDWFQSGVIGEAALEADLQFFKPESADLIHAATIEFDVSNRMGVPIRGLATCEIEAQEGANMRCYENAVKVHIYGEGPSE